MQSKLNSIINADCITILKEFPENSIDLIFADPPYNLQLKNELYRPNLTKVDACNDSWDQFSGFKEYDDFTKSWLQECQRVLKPTGSIWVIGTYHNIFRVGYIMQNLGYWILNDVCWLKTNPMPNFRGVRLTNAHETLIWAQKNTKAKSYTFNYQLLKKYNKDKQLRSDWYIKIEKDIYLPEAFSTSLCTGKERLKDDNNLKLHSTQKPVSLLERIILGCSNPSDIVLDPFAGTGTTGVVAKKHKRDYILIESNSEYIRYANARLDAIK